MDNELLAYLAGCMDSDGYFTIRRDTRSMRTDGRTPTHVAMIGLRQVGPTVPHLLQATFGGHLHIAKSSAANGRPLHSWVATATKASAACVCLMPYLRIKPAQAQVLIDLQARKGAIRLPGIAGVQRVTANELAIRDDHWQRVKTLNRVGVL